jgi:hypothetical protein
MRCRNPRVSQSKITHNFQLNSPYNVTYVKTTSNQIAGASQPPICADIQIIAPTPKNSIWNSI